MRQVELSTEVFGLIWSRRQEGEETEDDILKRVLKGLPHPPRSEGVSADVAKSEMRPFTVEARYLGVDSNSAWWQVVSVGLSRIGGQGNLSDIYKSVRHICGVVGKYMPPSFEAAVRATLEDNSSDSDRWKRVRDIFTMPNGKHYGQWAMRPASS